MRMIAGLEEVTDGAISFDDKPVNNIRPRDRNVAMAFETYALYPTLNIFENIAFPLRSAGWTPDKVEARVKEIAETMELTSILDRMPNELSGGQAQRAGLARALVREPAVFLLDEPISHLDTRQRFRMRQFIEHVHMELKYTMVYVTHDQEEAMAMADRIVIMHDGRISQIGTPDEVYQYPADVFVAGFVGEPPMNFLDGNVVQKNGSWNFEFGGTAIRLPDGLQSKGGSLPQIVRLGIRPYYINVSLDSSVPHDLAGEIFVVENLQDFCIVSVDVKDVRLLAVMPPGFRGKRHEPAYMKFDPAYIRLFNLQTEKAIQA